MIIDAHAHIGHLEDDGQGKDFPVEMLIKLMDSSEERIDVALISNLIGGGPESDQREANRHTKAAVMKYPDRLRGLVWVNPYRSQGEQGRLLASDISNTRECLRDSRDGENRYIFVGLKFHPYLNRYRFKDGNVTGFLKLAQQYEVPVAVHTAYDEYSQPEQVADVARHFPDLNFILYHAGLAPPDDETGLRVLDRVLSQDNLYIDISWLKYERLKRALDKIPDRVLFGTDLPLGGLQHYAGYFSDLKRYFNDLKRMGSDEKALGPKRSMLMHSNCRKIFKRLAD
ncbi:MAG TPA: amidohydrolase family protein [Pyrinomonadaceae bacterium]|jgi:predicted TIM-barrel fold metal-dependent hydrolase